MRRSLTDHGIALLAFSAGLALVGLGLVMVERRRERRQAEAVAAIARQLDQAGG